MQNSKLILVSSVAALALCAAPYGCSGKYVSEGSMGGRADGSAQSADGTYSSPRTDDGDYSPPRGGDGVSFSDGSRRDGYSPSDGGYSPPRGGDGTVFSDGGYSPPRGDGNAYLEGRVQGDGGYIINEDGGNIINDYDGSPGEGAPVSEFDGWDGLGEGVASYSEGQGDGSP